MKRHSRAEALSQANDDIGIGNVLNVDKRRQMFRGMLKVGVHRHCKLKTRLQKCIKPRLKCFPFSEVSVMPENMNALAAAHFGRLIFRPVIDDNDLFGLDKFPQPCQKTGNRQRRVKGGDDNCGQTKLAIQTAEPLK